MTTTDEVGGGPDSQHSSTDTAEGVEKNITLNRKDQKSKLDKWLDEEEEKSTDTRKATSERLLTSPKEETYTGTSKGVTRERLSTSHKVIFVDNLPSSLDKNGFVELFQTFGEIVDVKFLKHKTGAETGYGFVEFAEEDDGKRAITQLNWTLIENRNIRVSRAKPPTKKVSGTNLYVEKVPIEWTDQMLYDHFSKICDINQARVLVNRKNGESRGVGFVHCSSTEEANKAMRLINQESTGSNGFNLTAKFAKIPRSERKLQRQREGEGEPQMQGSCNLNTQGVEEQQKSVQTEIIQKKDEDKSSTVANGQPKSSEGKSSQDRQVAEAPNHREEKRKKKVKKKEKRQQNKATHLIETVKREHLQAIEDYEYHLNIYPSQPELNRSHSSCCNCRKPLRPSQKRNFFNRDQMHPIPNSHQPLFARHSYKNHPMAIPQVRNSQQAVPPVGKSCHSRGYQSSYGPAPVKLQHPPPTYHSQWPPFVMTPPPNRVCSSPGSSPMGCAIAPHTPIFTKHIPSPSVTQDYHQSAGFAQSGRCPQGGGYSSQLLQPSRTREWQRLRYSNQVSPRMMEYLSWQTQSQNQQPKKHCWQHPNRVYWPQSLQKNNLSISGVDWKYDTNSTKNGVPAAYTMQPSAYQYLLSGGGVKAHETELWGDQIDEPKASNAGRGQRINMPSSSPVKPKGGPNQPATHQLYWPGSPSFIPANGISPRIWTQSPQPEYRRSPSPVSTSSLANAEKRSISRSNDKWLFKLGSFPVEVSSDQNHAPCFKDEGKLPLASPMQNPAASISSH